MPCSRRMPDCKNPNADASWALHRPPIVRCSLPAGASTGAPLPRRSATPAKRAPPRRSTCSKPRLSPPAPAYKSRVGMHTSVNSPPRHSPERSAEMLPIALDEGRCPGRWESLGRSKAADAPLALESEDHPSRRTAQNPDLSRRRAVAASQAASPADCRSVRTKLAICPAISSMV